MTAIDTVLKRLPDGEAECVKFVVRTDEPTYRDRLVKMGWQPTSNSGEFTRRLDAAPDVEEIFERFSRHIETMVRQSARLDPIDWEEGLCEFVDRVDGSGLRWWLYGSGGWRCAALQWGRAIWISMSTTRTSSGNSSLPPGSVTGQGGLSG